MPDPARRNIDDMHRPVALAGDEQIVAVERHVHGLMSDLDRGLPAERWINQADRVALHAGYADHAVVRAVAGDLRWLRSTFEPHGARDLLALGVDQEKRGLLVVNRDHRVAVGRYRDAGERMRRFDLAKKFSLRQIDHRDR